MVTGQYDEKVQAELEKERMLKERLMQLQVLYDNTQMKLGSADARARVLSEKHDGLVDEVARLRGEQASTRAQLQARPALLRPWDISQGPSQTRMRQCACQTISADSHCRAPLRLPLLFQLRACLTPHFFVAQDAADKMDANVSKLLETESITARLAKAKQQAEVSRDEAQQSLKAYRSVQPLRLLLIPYQDYRMLCCSS